NDYIKLNVVEGDSQSAQYLLPQGGLRVLRWNNKEQFNLHSIYSKFDYSVGEVLDFEAVLRWDGSSTVQKDSRWLFTPGASARWNVSNQFFWDNLFNIKALYSRIGKPVLNSLFVLGTMYAVDLWCGVVLTVSCFYCYLVV